MGTCMRTDGDTLWHASQVEDGAHCTSTQDSNSSSLSDSKGSFRLSLHSLVLSAHCAQHIKGVLAMSWPPCLFSSWPWSCSAGARRAPVSLLLSSAFPPAQSCCVIALARVSTCIWAQQRASSHKLVCAPCVCPCADRSFLSILSILLSVSRPCVMQVR
jgi:hypothetical protein